MLNPCIPPTCMPPQPRLLHTLCTSVPKRTQCKQAPRKYQAMVLAQPLACTRCMANKSLLYSSSRSLPPPFPNCTSMAGWCIIMHEHGACACVLHSLVNLARKSPPKVLCSRLRIIRCRASSKPGAAATLYLGTRSTVAGDKAKRALSPDAPKL